MIYIYLHSCNTKPKSQCFLLNGLLLQTINGLGLCIASIEIYIKVKRWSHTVWRVPVSFTAKLNGGAKDRAADQPFREVTWAPDQQAFHYVLTKQWMQLTYPPVSMTKTLNDNGRRKTRKCRRIRREHCNTSAESGRFSSVLCTTWAG